MEDYVDYMDGAESDNRIWLLEGALRRARAQLVTLGGSYCGPDCDEIQCDVLRQIDAALHDRPVHGTTATNRSSIVMTKEEREAQRELWVIGEMMLENPLLTRKEAKDIYDSVK